ncbi:unnamed protein product [Heligmosomoides polygyrus]|uniref:G_PROTEIN_RECEP_F1_2 domain-containing protein n=1 Tax=Heligmosomoides polygyrus TaxID=6339 RepID=A0A183F338_HELPZ|nr:unnamed protein product [Heligmosomoides polygyrus]
MNNETLAINTYIMVAEVVVLNVLGVFGNIQLLWMTVRKSSFHSKPGILLGLNSFNHLLCLLFEVVDLGFALTFKPISRRTCYSVIFFYIFVVCHQSAMTLMMSVDLLIALLVYVLTSFQHIVSTPYRFCKKLFRFSFSSLEDRYSKKNMLSSLRFNITLLGLAPMVSEVWSIANISINSVVVVVYASIIALVHFRSDNKVIRRLKVIVIIFICSWYMAILGVNIGHAFGFEEDQIFLLQSNMLIFALICYTQTFYVCIWRSSEYMAAFKEQLALMMCWRKPRDPVTSSASKIFKQASSRGW